MSGEDTSAAEIADKILSLLSDICMIFNDKVPAFSYWAYIFAGLRVAFNVKRAKQLGHQMGGMPGGEVQMKQIEDFNINTAVSDPYANQVLKSIILELGINTDNANKHANASKLPKILGGLDFFMPYINKFDTQKKFKDLTSTNPSASTMEFKKGLLKITELIKAYQGLYRITGK